MINTMNSGTAVGWDCAASSWAELYWGSYTRGTSENGTGKIPLFPFTAARTCLCGLCCRQAAAG